MSSTEQFANNAITTLSSGITNISTSLTVVSAALFPKLPQFRILVETEVMLVTAVNGNVFTVSRGIENTVQTSHNSGATVASILTSGALTQFKTDIVTSLAPINSRYTPADTNTSILWTLNEAVGATTFANTGTSGTLNLISTGTNANPGVTGLFNNCVYFSGASGGIATPAGGTSTGEPTDPSSYTISVWVNINNYLANGIVFMKHREASPTGNNYSFSIQMSGSTDGSWVFYWTNSANTMAATNNTNNGGRIPLKQWSLLTVTFSSGTVNMYLNGANVGTSTDATHTTTNFGTHGRYSVGYLADGNVTPSDAYIDDIRVINGVMTTTAILAMYRNGIAQFDSQFGNPNFNTISDGYGNLPPPGVPGRLFLPTDKPTFPIYQPTILRDSGLAWVATPPQNSLFTLPPPVSSWSSLAYSNGVAPTSLFGGIVMDQPAINTPGSSIVKSLVSPGGSHVVTMFLTEQRHMPSTSGTSIFGVVIVGATNFLWCGMGYEGGVFHKFTQVRSISAFTFVSNPSDVSDTNPFPIGNAWWRLTFDDTNVTIDRCPVANYANFTPNYYNVATVAHTLGSISKVGVIVLPSDTPIATTLLSYTET